MAILELRNTIEKLRIRQMKLSIDFEIVEERISELENRSIEIIQPEEQKGKKKKDN